MYSPETVGPSSVGTKSSSRPVSGVCSMPAPGEDTLLPSISGVIRAEEEAAWNGLGLRKLLQSMLFHQAVGP